MAKNGTPDVSQQSPVQKLIADHLVKEGISLYAVARACGIQPGAVYKMIRRPTKSTHLERFLAASGAVIEIGGARFKLVLTDQKAADGFTEVIVERARRRDYDKNKRRRRAKT
jgi:predicted transcriptional regulator